MATLSFDILWKDRGAQQGLTNLGKTTEKTGHSFKALKVAGVAAVAAIGVGVAKFGKDSVKAYVEAEQSQIRLQDAFRKFPKLADTNVGSLNRLNSALALKTRFDDDATASGQAVLAQFNLTGQQITKLTPLMQDYAAKTGKDLPAAATLLGKAFNGNTKALKAIGINYKSTGDAGKDYENIQRLVNEKVGGFAEKEGKSAAGQAAILKNQFGELQETAGQQLLPALLKVGNGLLKLVGWVGSLSPMFSSFKKIAVATFGAFAESIGVGKASFKNFADFIETHQGDIVSGFVKAGKAAIALGSGIASAVSVGLRAFAMLVDSNARSTAAFLGSFGAIVKGAATAFGWIPGIGPKLKAADRSFSAFASTAVGGMLKAADGARAAADGIDRKLKPALDKAGRSLDAVGKKEIVKAKTRDAVAKAALAIRDLGTKSDGSQIKLKKFSDRTKLSATEARGLQVRLSNVRTALRDQLGAMRNAGAGQAKLSAAWEKGRDRLYKEFRQMGLSREEARLLAKRYAGIKPKVSTKFEQPGMRKSREDALDLDKKTRHVPNKSVTEFSAPGAKTAKNQIEGVDRAIEGIHSKSTSLKFASNATSVWDRIKRVFGKAEGGIVGGRARGGILPGFTPLSRGDDVAFPMATGGIQPLRKGEGIYVSEAMRDPRERKRLHEVNAAALRGQSLKKFQDPLVAGRARGGLTAVKINTSTSGLAGAFRGLDTGAFMSTVGGWIREGAQSLISETVKRFAAAARSRLQAAKDKLLGGGGDDPGGPAVGGGRNHVTWKGGTFTERFRNTLIRAQRLAGTNISVFQGGFSRRVAASGASHYGDAIDAQWNPRVLSGLRRARVAAWHRTPAQGFIHHIHGVPLPGAGFAGGSGIWQAQDYLRGGNGLAAGAVVRGGRGGVTTRIGEGRRDELVAPLPKNWENLVRVMERGGRPAPTVIYQVSFPNYVGDKADLKRALVDLNRGGHLDVIKRVA